MTLPTAQNVDGDLVPAAVEPSETSALLGNATPLPGLSNETPSCVDILSLDGKLSGHTHTTWSSECKLILACSSPLIFTFVLQNSLTLTSVLVAGHIGKKELGAISLGTMTANMTGFAVYHGLATSLDTLCGQAYGSGRKKLVGLYLQRMVLFLWICTIPISAIWLAGTQILVAIVPETDVAILAGQYLKILILGAPGYACFESAKRYGQAQGDFAAAMYVLLVAAPLNVGMHWLLVWQLQLGFIGCPIATVITETLKPLLLFLYFCFLTNLECWPGLTRRALYNWGPMVRLALPGLIMVAAELFAFEILTLASARMSALHLAAQAILQNISLLLYQLPLAVSIAGSTRVASLIGATLPDATKVTVRAMFACGLVTGLVNMLLLSSLGSHVPRLYTSEEDVIALAARTLPINATFQLCDAIATQCNGVLRGLGKHSIGGVVNLVAFYAIAIPVSLSTAFGLGWNLYGLWAGPAIALFVQAVAEGMIIYKLNWHKASEEASERNIAN